MPKNNEKHKISVRRSRFCNEYCIYREPSLDGSPAGSLGLATGLSRATLKRQFKPSEYTPLKRQFKTLPYKYNK